MKAKELRAKSNADIEKHLAQEREALRAFHFNEAGSRTRNVKAGKNHRKAIARALTELASRAKNA